jgi:hypothetical protein
MFPALESLTLTDRIVKSAYRIMQNKPTSKPMNKVNHKTVATLDIAGKDLTIKSRYEPDTPSGWAVIAFAPTCSIRTTKIHREEYLENYASAIAAACGSFHLGDVRDISDAVLSITLNPPCTE